MAIHLTPEANPTVQEGTLYVDSATGEFNVAGRTTPHIIPGVLYPAVSGNDLSGTALGGSYVYGTEHTDGRKYYYTDIKGSKPIKDPRIGGHFGSQRHRFSSAQLLEQETATQGDNVYSIDGREWVRAVGDVTGSYNNSHGTRPLLDSTSSYFEIVGYFSSINISSYGYANAKFRYSLDGASEVGTDYGPISSVNTPLGSRYVKAGSLVNIPISTTLGIHTIKLRNNHGTATSSNEITDIELIAQDTTSTANRSKIQIPSQNVVSYGKKFTVSGTPHYDPFNGFTNSTTAWPTGVDTDTSLGLANWQVVSGATTTRYRPYNGGRVVKWVHSDGTIKTSVTMMPPNAQNFGGTAINAKADASVANNTYLPTFSGAIDDSLSEVAKHYINEEFGNGAANGGTGATYADASMLSGSSDDIAYVMDDGLTSLSANAVTKGGASATMPGYLNIGSGDNVYTTFIGTGVTLGITNWNADDTHIHNVAFNLPYGTHILRVYNSSDTIKYVIDGVEVQSSYQTYWSPFEFTFHQPKRPPIPEDACVLADYMLMADFVAQGTTVTEGSISKGVRVVSGSRDHFIDGTSTFDSAGIEMGSARGFQGVYGLRSGVAQTAQLPFFGTRFLMGIEDTSVAHELTINGTSVSEDVYDCSATTGMDLKGIPTANVATLGVNTAKITMHGSNSGYRFWGTHVDTPIHTSSHYQTFETPFLHELVGGDRNMEQTNLVCSPDGKTWDEVTRDTSYLGDGVLFTRASDSYGGDTSVMINDDWRGIFDNKQFYNKDSFAIAYDRIICLKEGQYIIHFQTYRNEAGDRDVRLNGAVFLRAYQNSAGTGTMQGKVTLKRGDYLQTLGRQSVNTVTNFLWIKKA